MAIIRPASQNDQERVNNYLEARPGTTMFLRSNLLHGGYVNKGQRYQGNYAIAVNENNCVTGIVAHYWNGMLVVESDAYMEDLLTCVLKNTPIGIKGIIGPCTQVKEARAMAGLSNEAASLESIEDLFILSLDKLIRPKLLDNPEIEFRFPLANELNLLTEWRALYAVESLAEDDTPALRDAAAHSIKTYQKEGNHWVLCHKGTPVSYTAFNAQVPDAVQVGGVYTPMEHRGNSFARTAVAGSLFEAQQKGVNTAILFTNVENTAAQKAYIALGFEKIGDYCILLFPDELKIS